MIDQSRAEQFIGRQLRTTGGDKVGTIGQVFVDDQHGEPEWITVNTGGFGAGECFVPLSQATVSGNDLVVPYAKDQIRNAPIMDDSGHLSEAEEQSLYEHYGLSYSTEGSTFADTGVTEQVENDRARLRKWVETPRPLR